MDDQDMPVVEKATHLGIVRGTTIEKTEKETVSQNITKARRASYSLMSSGFHGETGFDPETSLHLLRIYTPQKNLRTSTYVFPLFNTESLIFKIENIF